MNFLTGICHLNISNIYKTLKSKKKTMNIKSKKTIRLLI